MHDAFITKNNAISLDAILLFLFNLSISSIAFIPKGVAALDNPIILAVKFITIAPSAFSSFAASLNKNLSKGFKSFAILAVSPLFSATFITPHQKHIIPVSSIRKVTVPPLPFTIASVILSAFPVKTANIIPKNIIKNQI